MRIRPSVRIGPFVISPGGRRRAQTPGKVQLRPSDVAVFLLAAGMMMFIVVMAVAIR